ncbi:hypothetical protein P4O66_013942 [Electrophorus voltai]|uniref:Uncharacterized protein n=1 Tax=Electrophorus voltai TaxID=2609070 RepID=A0AAD8YQX3_9TELE|nr:hypothetical protein P4O66_013942 [Electrophorus voltai]
MEVQAVLYGDPPTDNDVQSAVSKNDKPPAPKIPPRSLGLLPAYLDSNCPLCSFVPVPVSVHHIACPSCFVPPCGCACQCVCPYVCCHPGPCLPPSVLLALAHVGLLGPPALPFGVGAVAP